MAEEEEMWEEEGYVGITRLTFHRHTRMRCRFSLNSAQARLYGMHQEEAVARYGSRDLPQFFTEVDGLRMLIAGLGQHAVSDLLKCILLAVSCILLSCIQLN
jgi:hypothetical protein